MENLKFDPLTDFDFLDSDSASDDESYNDDEKVSFNDQLRIVQFLQKKLIEKSSQQSENKEKTKYSITSNRTKSERTKRIPNHQETSNQQGRNTHKNKLNNKVLSPKLPHKKDSSKDLPSKETKA